MRTAIKTVLLRTLVTAAQIRDRDCAMYSVALVINQLFDDGDVATYLNDAHCDGSLDWLAREHDYSDYDLEYGDIDWGHIDGHALEGLVAAACKAEPVA